MGSQLRIYMFLFEIVFGESKIYSHGIKSQTYVFCKK